MLLEFEKYCRKQSDCDADKKRLASKLAVTVHVAHRMVRKQQTPTDQLPANCRALECRHMKELSYF